METQLSNSFCDRHFVDCELLGYEESSVPVSVRPQSCRRVSSISISNITDATRSSIIDS